MRLIGQVKLMGMRLVGHYVLCMSHDLHCCVCQLLGKLIIAGSL